MNAAVRPRVRPAGKGRQIRERVGVEHPLAIGVAQSRIAIDEKAAKLEQFASYIRVDRTNLPAADQLARDSASVRPNRLALTERQLVDAGQRELVTSTQVLLEREAWSTSSTSS